MRLRPRAMEAMAYQFRQVRASEIIALQRRRLSLSLLRLIGPERRRRRSVGAVRGVGRSWSISGGLVVLVGR